MNDPQKHASDAGRVPPQPEKAEGGGLGAGSSQTVGDQGVAARYQIAGEIGRGGMGQVYSAYDQLLRRTVAMKLLLSESNKPEEIERFFREARSTAKLRHPNIVAVHDIGTYKGRPYFTMDFVEGETLKERLQKSPLILRQIVDIMMKVGRAVECAHGEGIVHRDLKPGNVMLDRNGEPLVMDFGLAKVAEASKQLSRTGMIVGTLNYMSPEQAEGSVRGVDERSDVYSLGAMLYEMLTGRPPFSGGSSFNILYQLQTKDPVLPSAIKSRIPKDVESVCMKAMEKKKIRRYQTAGEFVEDLARFERGEAVQARPVGAWHRRLRRMTGRGNFLPLAAALLFAALAFWAGFLRADRTSLREDSASPAASPAESARGEAPDAFEGHLENLAEERLCESAFYARASLLPGQPESFGKFAECAVQAAGETYGRRNWEAIADIVGKIEGMAHGGLSEKMSALAQDLVRYRFGRAKFVVSGNDERSGWSLFLFDTLTQEIMRISPKETYDLPSHHYLLYCVDPAFWKGRSPEEGIDAVEKDGAFGIEGKDGKDRGEATFSFALGNGENFELELKTVEAVPGKLQETLDNARPGWRVVLQDREYREMPVLGSGHSHLRIVGRSATASKTWRIQDVSDTWPLETARFSGALQMPSEPGRYVCEFQLYVRYLEEPSLPNHKNLKKKQKIWC